MKYSRSTFFSHSYASSPLLQAYEHRRVLIANEHVEKRQLLALLAELLERALASLSNIVRHPRRVVLEDLQPLLLRLWILRFDRPSELLRHNAIELLLQKLGLRVHELRAPSIVMEAHRVVEHCVHQLHPVVERPFAPQRVVESHWPVRIRTELRIVLGGVVFEIEVRRVAVQTNLLQAVDHAQKIGFLRVGRECGSQEVQLVVEELAGVAVPVNGRDFLRAVVGETVVEHQSHRGQKRCAIVRVQMALPITFLPFELP